MRLPISMRIDLRVLAFALLALAEGSFARELRVCADPNNLPFSNEREEGFENRIIDIVAEELDATVTYTWRAQRRGYVRNGLAARACDVIPGVAAGMEMLATTRPYYRSTYVFVSRAGRDLNIVSFDDERLRRHIIGVQLIGDDFANTPPAHALARRGIVQNVRGFPLYGDYDKPNPARAIVDAVGRGEIDVAVVWGPLAGYFAGKQPVTLQVTPVREQRDGSFPMTYAIAMGLRREDRALKQEIETALARRHTDIEAVLTRFGVPRVER